MHKNETCKLLCSKTYNKVQALFVNKRIQEYYSLNWLVDGLPAATAGRDDDGNEFFMQGFPIGHTMDEEESPDGNGPKTYMFNHYSFYIEYHEIRSRGGESRYRVVGASVQPQSRNNQVDTNRPFGANCDSTEPISLAVDAETGVVFTYSVYWTPSATAWATRWDKYLGVEDPKIHWFSLVNSAVMVVLLTSMVFMVVFRALRKDIVRYNQLDLNEDVQDDSGWKLIHGDVFRAPKNPLLLSIFLGSGAQLFFMTGITIAFALLGFLSPSNRGSLGTVMIILYTFFGFIGGYVSARVYKFLGGESWKRNIAYTPLLVPGVVFSMFFFLNVFLWYQQSSGAVPFLTMVFIIIIWFIISVPLSFAGSWCGFRAPVPEAPVRTHQIPRQIPPAVMYLRPIPSILLSGVMPFGAIFVELYFIMNSIWLHKVYYMFGFLFVCYGIMVGYYDSFDLLSPN
jgi:transmembrane 9 superfamily protein 2/4